MKRKWAFLCAVALTLSACAPARSGSGEPFSALSETPVADASDAVYENLRILTLDNAELRSGLQMSLDDVQWRLDAYGGGECRYINLAGTVSGESLGEETGVLHLENASYDSDGTNILPDGATAEIEWKTTQDTVHVLITDAAGTTLIELDRAPDGEVRYIAGKLAVTREEREALVYSASMLIRYRYEANGAAAPFVVQPVAAAKAGDAMTDDEAAEVVRSVLDAFSRFQERKSYSLMDLTHPDEGIVAERDDGAQTLFLPSLSFSTQEEYQAACDAVFLRATPQESETAGIPALLIWDGRVWINANQDVWESGRRVNPEKIEIVSREPERIVADVWETYNDSAVSAIPMVRSRYELTVQNGCWVIDRASSAQDPESYMAAVEAWDDWFNAHYAQFYLADGSDADMGTLWDMLGAQAGSWRGTEQGPWNENATLVSPEFAFSVRDGRYRFSLYSSLGSGVTTYVANSAVTDGNGNYIVTVDSVIGEMMTEEHYSDAAHPQLRIEMGKEGDGLIRIAGQGMDQLDGWMYEYEFVSGT